MGHIIDVIATKHILCITELNNFRSYDNSKGFAWYPRLWVNESGLYLQNYLSWGLDILFTDWGQVDYLVNILVNSVEFGESYVPL